MAHNIAIIIFKSIIILCITIIRNNHFVEISATALVTPPVVLGFLMLFFVPPDFRSPLQGLHPHQPMHS